MPPAPLLLQRRRRAHGGVDREVAHLFLGRGPHVPAAPVGGLAGGALASLLAHTSLARQVDAPQVEHLQSLRQGFVAARTAGRHTGVRAGRLLAGFGRAGGLLGRALGRRFGFRRLRVPSLRFRGLRALLLLPMLRRRGVVLVAAQRLAGPMRQRQRRGVVDVFTAGRGVAPVGGQGASRVVDHQVRAVA